MTMPLLAGGAVIGALNIFADGTDRSTDQDIEVARNIASPAAVTLANGRAYRQATCLAVASVPAAKSMATHGG